MKKTFVVSLGGSLIVPKKINSTFLKAFTKTIRQLVKRGYRFVIICGGGHLARLFQQEAARTLTLKHDDLDWLGIQATKMNAQIVRSLLKDISEETIIENPTKPVRFRKPVVIASGWKPGWSTDFDAVLLAKSVGAKTVVNMSNIDYVYTKDPRKYKSAKKRKYLSWKHYRLMVGDVWKPGFNSPFDPIAAREAQKSKIAAVIVGPALSNFESVIENRGFKGTVIK